MSRVRFALRHRAALSLLGLVTVIGSSPRVAAQTAPPDSARTEVLSWLRVGDPVQIEISGDRTFDGTVSRLGPDAVQVERGDETYMVAPSSIEAMWFKSRSSKKWAITGAIGGGVLGALYGGLFALYCSGESEDGGCGAAVPVFAFLGGLAGGVVGGVLGAAVPRWRPTYGPDVTPSTRPVRSTRGPIGLLNLRVSGGSSPDTDGGGAPFLGGSLGFYTGIGRHVAFGPDIGFQNLESDESVTFITGTLRVSTERDRPFAYGLASAGWHLWHVTVSPYRAAPFETDPGTTHGTDLSLFAGALGAGVGLPLGRRRPALVAEVRVTKNLQNLVADRDFNIVTASAGLEFAW